MFWIIEVVSLEEPYYFEIKFMLEGHHNRKKTMPQLIYDGYSKWWLKQYVVVDEGVALGRDSCGQVS